MGAIFLLMVFFMAINTYTLQMCGKKNKKGAPAKSEVPKSGIDASESGAAPPPAPDATPEKKDE